MVSVSRGCGGQRLKGLKKTNMLNIPNKSKQTFGSSLISLMSLMISVLFSTWIPNFTSSHGVTEDGQAVVSIRDPTRIAMLDGDETRVTGVVPGQKYAKNTRVAG